VIAGVFEEAKNVKDLSTLLREGKMKEFYQVANKVLRIKRNHPVVSRVKRDNETGEQKSSKTFAGGVSDSGVLCRYLQETRPYAG
jgi:hypothetical protein